MVSLRPATPGDAGLLRRWEQDPGVIACGAASDDWQWETELPKSHDWREQLIAEVDGRPIGFIQIIDPEREDSQYWGCIDSGHRCIDLWIGEPDARGRGYGTQMMQQAIERCFADPGVHTLLVDPVDSNTDARRFYEALGFEYVVRRCLGDDACSVYKLRRPADTRGHA